MEKPRLVSKFIWIEKNIGISLDQVIPGCGTIPMVVLLNKVTDGQACLDIFSNEFLGVLLKVCAVSNGKDFLKVYPVTENNGDIDNRLDKLNGSDHVALEKNGMQKRRRASSRGA
ncbi:30S ribosomal protein 3, chloroplastic-like protein, partial [Tanacetum coccineum]